MIHSSESTGLFISRTQGTHKGHLSALKQGIQQGLTNILYGIGSSDKERTTENPFTYQERETIATELLSILKRVYPQIDYKIFSIPDVGNNTSWRNYIETTLPGFDTLISGNPHVKDIRPDKNIIHPVMDTPYKGTHIRYQLQIENRKILQQSVPEEILKLYKDIDAPHIMQEIAKYMPTPDRLATDLIINYKGHYLVGERKHAPYGLALIGGMLDSHETLRECALREGYEELFDDTVSNPLLKLKNTMPLYILDDPKRDPRGRYISHVFEAEILKGEPTGGDDITKIYYLSPEEILGRPVEDFAFADHRATLLDHMQKNK